MREKLEDGIFFFGVSKSVFFPIHMFDLDGTLISTKDRKRVFPQNEHDWRWVNSSPSALIKIISSGGHVVVVTNQRFRDPVKLEIALMKVENVYNDFHHQFKEQTGVSPPPGSFGIYVITQRVKSKPHPYVWINHISRIGEEPTKKKSVARALFRDDRNPYESSGVSSIIYVGDMAGRIDDKSDSDRAFSYNINLWESKFGSRRKIVFTTPEGYDWNPKSDLLEKVSVNLKSIEETFSWSEPRPEDFLKLKKTTYDEVRTYVGDTPLILLVGFPGSGKSTLAAWLERELKFVIVSQDVLKKRDKCITMTHSELKKGNRVVVDNLNHHDDTRLSYKLEGYDVGIIHVATPRHISERMNSKRARPVPQMVYNGYAASFNKPTGELEYIPPIKPSTKKDMIEFLYLRSL